MKTSFEKWISPISSTFLENLVEAYHLNYYTKKLHDESMQTLSPQMEEISATTTEFSA